jgi:uncharacterized protein (DUF1015 family)
MAHIIPFCGLRPKPELARQVASPPYDVIDSNEARDRVQNNPYSFLHVTKPEINFNKNILINRDETYKKGADYLKLLVRSGILVQDQEPCFYIYHQITREHQQIGLVACASVNDYLNGLIKKHEHTHPEKVQDRFKLIKTLGAQTGPIFLTYRHKSTIDALIQQEMTNPIYDFIYDETVRHLLYRISKQSIIESLIVEFNELNTLYIADGHHRCEAAAQACLYHRNHDLTHSGTEQYNSFLSVIIPDNQVRILPYNRVIKDLHGLPPDNFLNSLRQIMTVQVTGSDFTPGPKRIGMYLDHTWYELVLPEAVYAELTPLQRLDVELLQKLILSPLLNIQDPRTDERIKFIGGSNSIRQICSLVDQGDFSVAFSLYPTTIHDIMQVADSGGIMPPKSTWFEPKLLSGLYTHIIAESFYSNTGESNGSSAQF